MAKQTFTTGQVLSAAQVNALQANDYNTTVSTKTASYVLVAADVGTTIVQNVATANAVTVNTGLFAAGDTLRIQNIGAGIATVTAGTATVNTANTLALPQWGSGILYFTSASEAIFFPSAGAAAAPSTAKSYALLATTSLTGATTTISGLSGYDNFFILIAGASSNISQPQLRLKLNAISTLTNYREMGGVVNAPTTYTSTSIMTDYNNFENNGFLTIGQMGNGVSRSVSGFVTISGANTSGTKIITYSTTGSVGADNNGMVVAGSISKDSAVISSLVFSWSAGNLDAGTAYVYGAA